MADALEELKKAYDLLIAQRDALKATGQDVRPLEEGLKRITTAMGGVAVSSAEMASKTRSSTKSMSDDFSFLSSSLAKIANAITDVGEGMLAMDEQFRRAFSGTPIESFVVGFDKLTAMTRNLRGSAIDVGSAFGLSFDQIRGSYNSYIASVLLAQNNTYRTRQEIQQFSNALAESGISLDEITSSVQIGGKNLNLLSEGFLLSADTGLREEKVFRMMADASRTMGLSIENAGKPIVALENIAKATGLPISQLSERVFSTAKQFAYMGLTIDGMTPVIRRFVDTLGPGFKGIAIDEATNAIVGLERQIDTTEAAFLAMRGGLARPGAGVAEAQLAFEDAFKNPIEIIKSLQTTLAGITGGRIIKFEEARANPELANQFKIQRDLLAQLTGNRDPQSQRILINILADLQSGRQLTSLQNKTLEDSLKSGTQKQEERASLQDRIGKAQVGLLTQISLNTSAFIERALPPQAQAGFARVAVEKGTDLVQRGQNLFDEAVEGGTKLLERVMPDSVKEVWNKAKDIHSRAIAFGEAEAANIRTPPTYSIPALPGSAPIPAPSRFAPPSISTTTPIGNVGDFISGAPTTLPTATSQATTAVQNIVITFNGTDEIGKMLARHATAKINDRNHGR